MILFWALATLLTVAVVGSLLWPLLRANPPAPIRAEYDLQVYRDQLQEIEQETEAQIVSSDEAAAAKLEIQRRLLKADAERQVPPPAGSARQRSRVTAAVLAIAIPLASVALYTQLGRPHLLSRPLAARDAVQNTPALPDRTGEIAELVGRLEARLQEQPEDVQGWTLLGRTYLFLDRPADAVQALRRAAALQPADAELQMALAEAQLVLTKGIIDQPALESFKRILSLDPTHPGARYYLALYKQQNGDPRGAHQEWLALYADTPWDAPWRSVLETQLVESAKSLKIEFAPTAPPLPPGAEDMIAGLSESNREEVVRGMVQRLADRLQENPADYDGWMRLGRAYQVLNQPERAVQAFRSALQARPGDATATRALQSVGVNNPQ